jgi:hypothetical protein
MVDTYFSRFPVISYGGANSINIMARVNVLDKVYNNPSFYYSVDVPEFVRPDHLSNELYRDSYFSWLIYLANKVIDPYYQWNMDSHTFDSYIVDKYGSVGAAQSRVAYWQTNWFNDPVRLTPSQYSSLIDVQKKYYEPVISDANIILEYKRREIDWVVNTNQIWEYTTTGDASLTIDEKINLGYNSNVTIANAQVLFANSSYVRVQHVYGQANQVTSITGSINNKTVTVTSANEVAINIPLSEQVYWNGISYYDVEELKNKQASNITLLSEKYTKQASLELKRLLNP